MTDFKAKMHQIRFWQGLRPRSRWGSLQRSPDPLAGFGGGLLLRGRKGRAREEREGEAKGGEGKEGRKGKGEGREGEGKRGKGRGGERKGKDHEPPPQYLEEVYAYDRC